MRGGEPTSHGNVTGWGQYGCRCDACETWYRGHQEALGRTTASSLDQGRPFKERSEEWLAKNPKAAIKYRRRIEKVAIEEGRTTLLAIQKLVTTQGRQRQWRSEQRRKQQRALQSGAALLREMRWWLRHPEAR
jgi:hypothetical protein